MDRDQLEYVHRRATVLLGEDPVDREFMSLIYGVLGDYDTSSASMFDSDFTIPFHR